MQSMKGRALLVLAVLALTASACGGSGTTTGGTKQLKVCDDESDLANPAVVSMVDAMKAEAAKHPQEISFSVQYTTGVEDQVSKMETMIAQHCDVIGLHPRDAKAVTPAITEAHDKGIKVILLVDDVPGAVDSGIATQIISGDEQKGGADLGTWLAKTYPDGGEYAIIMGESGNFAAIYRSKGFTDAAAANPAWKKVAENSANWARDQGLTVATNMLTAHPNLKAIFANNDEMAFGALQAIKARNKFGKVALIGYNGTCIGIQATLQGNFQADGILPIPEFGQQFILSALAIGKGQTIPKTVAPPIVSLSTEQAKGIQAGTTQPDPASLKGRIAQAASGCS